MNVSTALTADMLTAVAKNGLAGCSDR